MDGFCFFGYPTVRKTLNPVAWIVFEKEDDCVLAAQHWAKVTNGHTTCHCMQDGMIGRAFSSFWGKDIVFRR